MQAVIISVLYLKCWLFYNFTIKMFAIPNTSHLSLGSPIHRTKKQICIKFALCKYVASMQLCTALHTVQVWRWPNLPVLCKFGHCHLCTGCKALQISYLQHICTRQIWGKFDFSSSDTDCASSNL